MLCSMLVCLCADTRRLWRALVLRLRRTRRRLDENNEDESLRQLEEGTKDARLNV